MSPTGVPPQPLDRPRWPNASDVPDSGAAFERYKQELSEAAERRTQFPAARHESHVAVENAQIEVIKGALERSRDSAKHIQVASSAIAALYTGVAGLIFSVDKDQPLPARGVLPVLFLGAAIVFSTYYLAWLSPTAKVRPFPKALDAVEIRVERVKWLNDWVSISVLRQAWALRIATLCLAAGLVLLPVAFVPVTAEAASSDSPGSTSELTPWPDPPRNDISLDRILYRAQVEEVAKQREKPATDTPSASSGYEIDEAHIFWAAAGMAGFILIFTLMQLRWGSLARALKHLEYEEPPAT